MSTQERPAKNGLGPGAKSMIVRQVEASVLAITSALNDRDFSEETWDALLSPRFTVESDILRSHGAEKVLTLPERRDLLQRLCVTHPELECVILDMDTTVDDTGLHAVVAANRETRGMPTGVTKRSVVFWHFEVDANGNWLCVGEKMIHGMGHDGYAR